MSEEIKEQMYLLCVDPDSQNVYTLDPNTNQVIIEENVSHEYRQKVSKAIDEFFKIMGTKRQTWLLASKECQRYQRRKIPYYLLSKDACQYPKYVCNSDLSFAFSRVNTIKFNINLSFYKDFLGIQQQNQINPNFNFNFNNSMNDYNNSMCDDEEDEDFSPQKKSDPRIGMVLLDKMGIQEGRQYWIQMDVALIISANQLIKNIILEINKKYQKFLKPAPNNTFILQIHGFKEYLYGNQALLNYDRVRISLRGHDHLDIQLIDIPTQQLNEEKFPPIVMRNKDEIKKGFFKQINWQEYEDIEILLWYPPIKLKNYHDIALKTLKIKEKVFNQIQSNDSILVQSQNDLASVNEKIQNFNKKLESCKHLRSGEIDFPFRLKISGLENLFQIFVQDDEGLDIYAKATYNGMIPPQYITKTSSRSNQIINALNQQNQRQEQIKQFPKFFKSVNRSVQQINKKMTIDNIHSKTDIFDFKTDFNLINHGVNGSFKLIQMTNRFGLDFIPYLISVEIMIYHGSQLLFHEETHKIPFNSFPRWQKWITFEKLKISQIPQDARCCFNVKIQQGKSIQIIACTTLMIFDENGRLNSGLNKLNLWPFYKIDDRLSCMQQYWGLRDQQEVNFNLNNKKKLDSFLQKEYSRLFVQFDDFEQSVYYSLRDEQQMLHLGFSKAQNQNEIRNKNWNKTPITQDLARLHHLLRINPLDRDREINENDKFILMICRNHYKSISEALQLFTFAIDQTDSEQLKEAYTMLNSWKPINPYDALSLLNAHQADRQIRLYSSERISTMPDDELVLFILQLQQTLLFEPRHMSPLSEMILEKALKDPHSVGRELFWELKSQLYVKSSYERNILLLESFIMLCGSFRSILCQQIEVTKQINQIALNIKKQGKSLTEQMNISMKNQLVEWGDKYIIINKQFLFATDNRIIADKIIIDQCYVLNSKKLPLLLVMQNSQIEQNNNDEDGQSQINMIFKCGDDIRQDKLCLQMIKIMDKFWLKAGYDFKMKPYKVMATEDQVGWIEVVKNSDTIQTIHKNTGGTFGALKSNTIWLYLKQQNKDPHTFEIATDNFLRSCAGYCVATYVLGIGDRHSGNIMLTKTGHLFHIDFGHILGNFKTKFYIQRERAPFVFTEEMAFIMGGRQGKLFQKFEEYCTVAYNVVRKHGNLLINIFLMMLSAGLPELQHEGDIEYLKKQLALDLSEKQATNRFKQEIIDSLNTISRRIDNLIHNFTR